MFRDRLETLLSLGGRISNRMLEDYLLTGEQPNLPAGCSVDVELEAKELLAELLSTLTSKGSAEVVRAYRELRRDWGRRPTMKELYQSGRQPSVLEEDWFSFLRDATAKFIRWRVTSGLRDLLRARTSREGVMM